MTTELPASWTMHATVGWALPTKRPADARLRCAKRTLRLLGVLANVAIALSASAADIYQWTGTDGVSHYTNLKEFVPPNASETVKVYPEAPPRSTDASSPAVAAEPPARRQPDVVVYDQSAL